MPGWPSSPGCSRKGLKGGGGADDGSDLDSNELMSNEVFEEEDDVGGGIGGLSCEGEEPAVKRKKRDIFTQWLVQCGR